MLAPPLGDNREEYHRSYALSLKLHSTASFFLADFGRFPIIVARLSGAFAALIDVTIPRT
jgi:hypothetical protein